MNSDPLASGLCDLLYLTSKYKCLFLCVKLKYSDDIDGPAVGQLFLT